MNKLTLFSNSFNLRLCIQSHICTYLLFTILCCSMHISNNTLLNHFEALEQWVYVYMYHNNVIIIEFKSVSKIETDLYSFFKWLFNNIVISNFVKTQTNDIRILFRTTLQKTIRIYLICWVIRQNFGIIPIIFQKLYHFWMTGNWYLCIFLRISWLLNGTLGWNWTLQTKCYVWVRRQW